MALLDASQRSATVLALQEAETLSVYKREFDRLRAAQPAVNDALVGFLASEIRMLNERLLEALYMPVERRVRRRLVALVVSTQILKG